MVDADRESTNSVANSGGGKFHGGRENCTGQPAAYFSKPRLSVAPSLLRERYLLPVDHGGRGGRD